MDAQQKCNIKKYIALYQLGDSKRIAAEGFILPAATTLREYLHRLDLPRALEPICAQLAIAQAVSAGMIAIISKDSSADAEGESSSSAEVKSITQGDTTISLATGADQRKEAASVANSSKVAITPAQVIEQNKIVLDRYRRGIVMP